MRVHHSNPDRFFTIVPSQTARDHELSFTARGILAYLLSQPDGHRDGIESLASKSVEGRKAVAAALRELKDRGYMVQRHVRGDAGRITTVVDVYDVRDGAKATEAVPSQVAPNATPVASGEPAGGNSAPNPLDFKTEIENLPPTTAPEAAPVETVPEGRAGGVLSQAETTLEAAAGRDARLHLSGKDRAELAPLVDAWFANGADADRVVLVLTEGLPAQIHAPAALVRSRLTSKMPTRPLSGPRKPAQSRTHHCPQCSRPMPAERLCEPCANEARETSGPRNWREMAKASGHVGTLVTA